jgi:hypothetical protein
MQKITNNRQNQSISDVGYALSALGGASTESAYPKSEIVPPQYFAQKSRFDCVKTAFFIVNFLANYAPFFIKASIENLPLPNKNNAI